MLQDKHDNPFRTFDDVVKDHLATCPGATDVDDSTTDGHLERLRFLMTALAGEAGEALNLIKKEWRGDGGIQDDLQSWEAKLTGEIVDVANYVSMLAAHMDIALKVEQRKKFLAVQQRPEWADWQARQKQPAAAKLTELEPANRDDIRIECSDPRLNGSVPLHPLGTVCERVREFNSSIINGGGLFISVESFRTSKETIDSLMYIAGVVKSIPSCGKAGAYRREFMGRRIRAWGDYS